jgi:hypothetical protein
VVRALPDGVRPVILADRGFAWATFFAWLRKYRLEYVVRIDKGTYLTEVDGRRWKLGEEGLRPAALGAWGALRSLPRPSPRDPALNVALCWKLCKSRAADAQREQPEEPWYLAASLSTARRAASWYWQRGWIERSFRDAKSCFGLKRVKVGSRERLGRLLVGLTIALCWLTLMALPEGGVLPKGFRSTLVAWGAGKRKSASRSRFWRS